MLGFHTLFILHNLEALIHLPTTCQPWRAGTPDTCLWIWVLTSAGPCVCVGVCVCVCVHVCGGEGRSAQQQCTLSRNRPLWRQERGHRGPALEQFPLHELDSSPQMPQL